MASPSGVISPKDQLVSMLRLYCEEESTFSPEKNKLRSLLGEVPNETKLETLRQEYHPNWTVLKRASYRDDNNIITILISSVDQKDRLKLFLREEDHTALHTAAVHGRTEAVKAILNCLTRDQQLKLMDEKANDGETAMQWAELGGRTDRVLREYINGA